MTIRTETPTITVDRLSALLDRFRVRARLFHQGPLCGVSHFDAHPGRGFLHLLRRGPLDIRHAAGSGAPQRLSLTEPSLMFYPRPLWHEFRNPPRDGSDFACATVELEGGERNPLSRALPPLLVLPLARVEGLEGALTLLFAETDRLRCGSRLLADRLFEVVLIQLLRWLIDHPDEAGTPVGLLAGLAHPRLAPALVAMHEAPGASWSLEGLAAVAGMSRTAFSNTFRDRVGQTAAAYLADWRIGLAAAELRSGRDQKSVARELGYGSASALSRAFKQRLGSSPTGWARSGT
ncbi:AraC family transcriptional regulator [uncultured Methylibium sp.]|uniref:AraC family transcriptional regulator n=1 Tax=uncultured Methylibium sp. TaxID=381093 RepID=UPI0025E334EE|nr:AraC family transcriptional regulator [uncultured Methylibium sp.]